MISSTHWNVPYIFKDATILHDNSSWTNGQRLEDLFKEKFLSFRIGKRQNMLFGSLLKCFFALAICLNNQSIEKKRN